MFKKDNVKKLWKLIKKAKKILLVSHIRMDPDTFWSMWALYYILKSMWKDVKAANDDMVPESFWFMWANNIVKKKII